MASQRDSRGNAFARVSLSHFLELPPPRLHFVWRSHRAPGIFSQRIRLSPQVAGRIGLCRHRRPLPVSTRPGKQPGRLHHRPSGSWCSRRSRGVGRIHTAVSLTDVRVRPRPQPILGPLGSRHCARARIGSGRGYRTGCFWNDAHARARPHPRSHRRHRGSDRAAYQRADQVNLSPSPREH